MSGENGWILLIFAGINNQTTGPQSSCKDKKILLI